MLAAPARPTARSSVRPSVAVVLRAIEGLLLGAGHAPARRNAWTAVLEDRRRAKARHEAEHVLEAMATRTPQAT